MGTFRDPTGAGISIRYDGSGRLVELNGPDGVSASYERTDVDGGFTVTRTTGGGRKSSDSVLVQGTKVVRTHVDFAGLKTTVETDGLNRTLTAADGTVAHVVLAGDPRWGLASPVPSEVVMTTPVGRKLVITETRTASPASSPTIAPSTLGRSITIDGESFALAYDPATRKTTLTEPGGRTRTTTSDEFGRAIRVQSSGSEATTYHYDDHGRIDTVTVGEGPEARVWQYKADRVTGDLVITDPLGRTTTIGADTDGRVATVEGFERRAPRPGARPALAGSRP